MSRPTSRTGSGGKGGGGTNHRVPRVEREIREVVGRHLLGGFRSELPGMVSVSRVIASRDLSTAKILVTIMGEVSDRKAAIKELQAHAHEFQHVVNRHLQMKHCPKLSFHYDEGFENALRVERILHELSVQREAKAKEAAQPAGDANAEASTFCQGQTFGLTSRAQPEGRS